MKLDRVTMTGADDSVSPGDLAAISKDFPFVEWGILASRANMGSARFPEIKWIDKLQHVASEQEMKLSLHLCGSWVRDLLVGKNDIPQSLFNKFQRVQLNFHAERTRCEPKEFFKCLLANPVQYIFQIDGELGNKHLCSIFSENGPNGVIDAVPLFDVSGGAGILPTAWPKPSYMANDVSPVYHGYAGGLGPLNLKEQIQKIGEAAGDTRIWIDMETRVRSEDDQKFDLVKVRECLEIAAPFVTQ